MPKTVLIMKLIVFMLLAGCLQVSAKGFSQSITLSEKKITLQKVFVQINRQTGVQFFFKDRLLDDLGPIDINVKNESLEHVLAVCFKDLPLTYEITDKMVTIKKRTEPVPVANDNVAVVINKITGQVLDEKNNPMVGAAIRIVGTGKGINTDKQGKFSIDANAGDVLEISFVGYKKMRLTVGSNNQLMVQMQPEATAIKEVVVVGYGTQEKELVTGSVGSLKMDETRRLSPSTSLGNLIAGQFTGVRVTTPVGVPGAQPGIYIRAASSWNAQPVLYVIDGKVTTDPADFNNLSPNDIDNISVLKDAASTAVYGSRAAAGVIVVTTRTGVKNGKPQINYSFSTGFEKRGKNVAATSAIELGEMYNRNFKGVSGASLYTQSDFDFLQKINNGWGYNQLDDVWQDPSTTAHNLSVTGGSDKIKYFVGGSYTKENGMMKNLTYGKYNMRANITADITKNLSVFTSLSFNNNLTNGPMITGIGNLQYLYYAMQTFQPYLPTFTNGGHAVDWGWIGNTAAEVRGDGGYNKSNFMKPVINLQATYKIPGIKGLNAVAGVVKTYSNTRTKYYSIPYQMYNMGLINNSPYQYDLNDANVKSIRMSTSSNHGGKSFLQEDYAWANDYQLNLQLNYEHTFGNRHHVKGWLIYERAEAQSGGISAGRESNPVYTTDQWWAFSNQRADGYTSGSNEVKSGRKSWIGQAFYDYENKYMATFAYRYDGSMNFAPDHRWGFFPSGSLGWIVSKENFFKRVHGVDMLKLRGSVGLVGNDNVGGWQWQQTYQAGTPIFLGTSTTANSGLTYGGLTNPDLTWEKSLKYNAGFDIDFLKHFNATAEYYFTKTTDILGAKIASVPPTFARTLPASNYGQINTQGVEFSLGYRNKAGDVNYYVNANAGFGSPKYVIRDENVTYPWQKTVGRSTSFITGYETDGMFRTQAQLDAFKSANPSYTFNGVAPQLGQLIYKDLSGPSGKPDGKIDNWDQTILKNNNNYVTVGGNLGAKWKGISVDATINGYLHYYNYVNGLMGGYDWNRVWEKLYTDTWTPDNPNANYPKRTQYNDASFTGGSAPSAAASSFFLKNSSLIRLSLLNIGYSIPKRLTDKVGIQGLKVYFSGSNLVTFSKFVHDFYDPEAGPFNIPVMKNFSFGASLSL